MFLIVLFFPSDAYTHKEPSASVLVRHLRKTLCLYGFEYVTAKLIYPESSKAEGVISLVVVRFIE